MPIGEIAITNINSIEAHEQNLYHVVKVDLMEPVQCLYRKTRWVRMQVTIDCAARTYSSSNLHTSYCMLFTCVTYVAVPGKIKHYCVAQFDHITMFEAHNFH